MKIGMLLRTDLENLSNDTSYDFLRYTSDKLGKHINIKSKEQIDSKNVDFAFFFNYPFNKEVCLKYSELENKINFINKPSGVLKTSEKIFELNHFQKYLPETKILSHLNYESLSKYISDFNSVVIKPINGTGGKGISFLDKPYLEEDILKLVNLSQMNPDEYLIQEFIENDGATRILYFNGVYLGGVKRRSTEDRIHNISRGADAIIYQPTKKEFHFAQEISNTLKNLGLYLIGIDTVNETLLEVNTSMPGCLGLVENPKNAYDKIVNETLKIIKNES